MSDPLTFFTLKLYSLNQYFSQEVQMIQRADIPAVPVSDLLYRLHKRSQLTKRGYDKYIKVAP